MPINICLHKANVKLIYINIDYIDQGYLGPARVLCPSFNCP